MKVIILDGVAGGASCAARILLQNGFKARNISGGRPSRSMLAAK
jgi:hypothetical protein